MMENVKIWIGLINKKIDNDNAASFLLGQPDLLIFVFTHTPFFFCFSKLNITPKLSTCPLNSIGTRAHRAQCKHVGSIAMPFSHCESEQVWCVKIALERRGDEIFGHVESTELVLKSNKCPSIELSRTVTLWWCCLRWVSCRYVSLW